MTDDDRILLNHLKDLQKRAERSGISTFSGFLSLPEQDLFLRNVREYGFHDYRLEGGVESAERRIVVFSGDGEEFSPKPPIVILEVTPLQEKYAEELSHRDGLGAMMSLGIDRSLTGDILIRDKRAWIFCLQPAADMMISSLGQVRRTAVTSAAAAPDVPELQPRYAPLRLNVASERLDAVAAAFTGLSRGQTEKLFSAEKVFVNGRTAADRSARLKEGDTLSVRGFGKAVYDGIEYETKKNRLRVRMRKLL